MPQATPELRAKFPEQDSEAWKVLEDSQRFMEFRFLIFPADPSYTPTEREGDAIDYLIQEWDWDYDRNYVNSDEWKAEHARRMKIVHAVWLISYLQGQRQKQEEKKLDTASVINEVALLLGYEPQKLFAHFDRDYLDRAWCSRPVDWKPQDSLA